MVCWLGSVMFSLKRSSLTKFLGLTAFKGILGEVWLDDNMTTLEHVKWVTSEAVPQTLDIEQDNFSVSLKANQRKAGVRMRTYFLCSLTGIYEFYFSCFGACEWCIKESEDEEVNITSGSSHQGMQQQEFKE